MPQQKPLTKEQKKEVEKHISKKLLKHLPTKAELIKQQFKQHVSTAIIAAFSFLIALAWKDLIVYAIQSIIKPNILEEYPYLSYLISAIIITLIAVMGIAIVSRWAKDTKVIVSEMKTK